MTFLILGFGLFFLAAVSVAWKEQCTITETLGDTDLGSSSNVVVHSGYDLSGTLTSGTTPPVTLQASFLMTLTSGTHTIDLRNLVGTNGAVIDGNGLKVQILRIKNLGANPMTFAVGGSNGHTLFTADGLIVQPGGSVQIMTNDNSDDIDGSHKTWDVTGTGAQTAQVTIVMG